MIVQFNTNNQNEVEEVKLLLETLSKSVVKRTETVVEDKENVSEGKSIPKEEKAVQEPKKRKRRTKAEMEAAKEKEAEKTLSLNDLKELAKNKAISVGRTEVKNIINKYAPKLAEVDETKYEELFNDLTKLEK